MMNWTRVFKSFQVAIAHGLLFSFSVILSLKLDHAVNYSWCFLNIVPITFVSDLYEDGNANAPSCWFFSYLVISCSRSKRKILLPAPSMPHGRHWAPFHAIVAAPLLIAFELLLCVHLEKRYAVNLKIVFLPLLALEAAILVDNIRMCRALMPADDDVDSMSDEAVWETLPHFWISISMVFFIAATTFTLLKLCGNVVGLGWWDLFINYGVAECFAFLICTKWYNP
ncbi:uncharacterized protein LOC125199134 [Salvia hispanica]|uniref:uncharacterized protein LOC125199134 n=1 Tax=Salvia hispanica TaxID=49212 RepID=UPI0020099378|nr:uncharacterized protein LOC125199134 [Salvia hispanica]